MGSVIGSVKSSVSKEPPFAWDLFQKCPVDQKLFYEKVVPFIKAQTNIPLAEFYELLKYFLNEFDRLFYTQSFDRAEFERL